MTAGLTPTMRAGSSSRCGLAAAVWAASYAAYAFGPLRQTYKHCACFEPQRNGVCVCVPCSAVPDPVLGGPQGLGHAEPQSALSGLLHRCRPTRRYGSARSFGSLYRRLALRDGAGPPASRRPSGPPGLLP